MRRRTLLWLWAGLAVVGALAPRFLPTPPAAAWNRIVCLGPTGNVARSKYRAVMPCNIMDAA